MFEASLYTLLASDTELQAKLNSYGTEPAIFSSIAPENAELPYIVYDIEEYSTDNLGVSGFDINLDIYDRSSSGKIMREIAERIKFICDRYHISGDSRYGIIRIFWNSGREVENKDIDIRHYVIQCMARAGRKSWMAQL